MINGKKKNTDKEIVITLQFHLITTSMFQKHVLFDRCMFYTYICKVRNKDT